MKKLLWKAVFEKSKIGILLIDDLQESSREKAA
jgi:hypothetical protein